MTDFDQTIRKALSEEDQEFLAKLDKETPIDEVLSTFKGRWAHLNVFAAIITFASFGFLVYAAIQMAGAEAVRETVLWAVGVMLSALFVAMLKMWFWMEMHRNQMLRELKRLELQVARLRQGGA